MKKRGSLLVISGPSGAGKSSLIDEILNNIDDVYFSISTTTRKRRETEVDGVDYYFVSKEDFEEDIKKDLFLEWAMVHGNYYGTSLKPVYKALSDGKLVVFDIDVQGHRSIKEKVSDIMTSVFVTTPTLSELERRLKKRGTDSSETIKKRVQNAIEEIKSINEFDFILINNDFDRAKESILSIANAAKLKYSKDDIDKFISNWIDN
ncbi:MAG TPA: guanylate kinase [Campylobacterales bacterium]|nr:guanylate kinase [Campylobacterales bacterium]